jgi:hypothetical protein
VEIPPREVNERKKEGQKVMKRIINLLLINLMALTLVFSFSINQINAATNTQEIDLATSPEKVLFDLTDLKPGDWAERTLIIQNKGKQDFKYLSASKLIEGSEEFYNELLLKISDEDKVLFDGKIEELTKLDPRFIAKNDSEQLFFKVVVPEELGNEYQGLSCKVEFKFYVEGTLGGVLPVDGPRLPNTGTMMFNILVTGAVLILTGTIIQFVIVLRRKIAKQV